MKITYNLINKPLSKPLKTSNLKLRDYQEGVVEEILESGDSGIIKLGTAWGKTIIACELIRKL